MMKYEKELHLARSKNIPPQCFDVGNVQEEVSDLSTLFTADDKRTLKAIPLFKSCDSEYARMLFRIMYRDDKHKIAKRVLKATSKSDSIEVTPLKMKAITHMMNERMKNISDDIERCARNNPKYIRQIISQGLSTVKKGDCDH